MRIHLALLVVLVSSLTARAAASDKRAMPNIPLPERAPSGDVPKLRFVTVTPEMTAGSSKPGGITFSISPGTPMRISRLQGTPFGEIALYRRSPRVGETEKELDVTRAWEIQFVANLNPRNVKGNVMFLIYDREDPTAPARHAFQSLWEATMSPFHIVAARAWLDPEADGFHATHTYLLKLVQQWNQREVTLAQGTFRLE